MTASFSNSTRLVNTRAELAPMASTSNTVSSSQPGLRPPRRDARTAGQIGHGPTVPATGHSRVDRFGDSADDRRRQLLGRRRRRCRAAPPATCSNAAATARRRPAPARSPRRRRLRRCPRPPPAACRVAAKGRPARRATSRAPARPPMPTPWRSTPTAPPPADAANRAVADLAVVDLGPHVERPAGLTRRQRPAARSPSST